MLLDNPAYTFCLFADIVDISSIYTMLLYEASSVILNNYSHLDNCYNSKSLGLDNKMKTLY